MKPYRPFHAVFEDGRVIAARSGLALAWVINPATMERRFAVFSGAEMASFMKVHDAVYELPQLVLARYAAANAPRKRP